MRSPARQEQPIGLFTDDEAHEILESLLDSSGTAASCLTPGYDIDAAIERAARRVERKPRLDELDEQQ